MGKKPTWLNGRVRHSQIHLGYFVSPCKSTQYIINPKARHVNQRDSQGEEL